MVLSLIVANETSFCADFEKIRINSIQYLNSLEMDHPNNSSTGEKQNANKPLFANFMQIEQVIPQWVWQFFRLVLCSIDRITGIKLKTAESLSVDLALIAAGIVTNKKLTEKNNLNHSQGLLVGDHLRTNIRHIFAAGDIAQLATSKGQLPGLWPVAVEQGCILLGHPEYASKIIGFINIQKKLSESELEKLNRKDWSIFR